MPKQRLITEQEYTREVLRTYAGPDTVMGKLNLGALGLTSESGTVIDMIHKCLFQGREIDRTKMLDELGDIHWCYMLICEAMAFTLQEVMQRNIETLRLYYPDGFVSRRIYG